MADPLSAGASVVTLLGACTVIGERMVKFVQALRDAPSELMMLSNEVNEVTAVLMEIEHVRLASTGGDNITLVVPASIWTGNSPMEMLFRSVRAQLVELDNFIKSLRKDTFEGVKIDRIKWARNRKTGLKLWRRLAGTKNGFYLLLDASTTTSRIQSAVQSLSTNEMRNWGQNHAKLDLILTQIMQLTSDLQASSQEPDAEDQSFPLNVDGNITVTENNSRSSIRNQSFQGNCTIGGIGEEDKIAGFQFQQRTPDICDDSCNCICHLRDRSWWRSPLVLRNVVGFFFLGYTGFSLLKPACSDINCKSFSSSRAFKVTYCVPRWLLSKAVHMAMGMTTFGDPQLFLTLQARTNEFAPNSLYHLAQRNNIKGIESVFDRRMASPNDADQRTGSTALHFSIRARRIEATRLLLARGANTQLEDDYGVSAIHAAWDEIYSQGRSRSLPEGLQELTRIFPEYRSLDFFDFSNVHKVVPNIFPLSLDRLLLGATWRSQKDFKDAWGRRPIHWAVRRDDVAAVEALIRASADVNAQDHEQQAPLHIAASLSDISCLQLLLKAKAAHTVRDASGNGPIHFASETSIAHIQALIKAGSSLDMENNNSRVPLGWAACSNSVDIGRYLIEQGVNKDHADTSNGDTALFSAISSPHKEFVSMLLDSGVNVQHLNKHGATILHWVGRCANTATLDMLSARLSQFRCLNTSHRDSAGLTAREVLQNRVEPPDGFREAFERFISSLEELQQHNKAGQEVEKPDKTISSEETVRASWSLGELIEFLTVSLIAVILTLTTFIFD